MTQETRLLANRSEVLRLIRSSRARLIKALESLSAAEDALNGLRAARADIKKAGATAQRGPEFGARPLPRRIRGTLDRVLKAIDAAEERIKTTPVTRLERDVSRAKKRSVSKRSVSKEKTNNTRHSGSV